MTEERKDNTQTAVSEEIAKSEEIKQEKKLERIPQKKCDNNLTISTKLSTDQLICKSPQNSPNLSDRSSAKEQQKTAVGHREKKFKLKFFNLTLCLGILQMLLGLLMSVFGVLTIIHGASLSQLGGGLWGGCLAVATGTCGVLTAARDCCPLKKTAQHIAHTVFLALSLISLAVAQLVMVLSATGLSRDLEKSNSDNIFADEITTLAPTVEPSSNYTAALTNVGLLIVSALECICAAIASYKGARAICPCFSADDEQLKYDYPSLNPKHAFVNSWLGKHNPPPFYVVAAHSSIGRHSKLSSGLPVTSIYTLPPPPPTSVIGPPSMVGYPLIPAPLGPLPSPGIKPRMIREYIHAPTTGMFQKEKYEVKPSPTAYKKRQRSRSRSRSKSKERCITTEEVTKTYTGLDRTIAEEFIDICDSRNNSLCSSETSCQSCCQCSSQTTCQLCSNASDVNSREYLVDNK